MSFRNAAEQRRMAVVQGSTITAKWEAATDEDWFAVTLEANETYRFWLTPGSSPSGLDGFLSVRSADMSEFVFEAGTNVVVFTPDKTGTFFVSAQGIDLKGSYRLSAKLISDDRTDNVATTGSLPLGVRRTGKWEAVTDDDWFGVTLQANKTYKFTLDISSTLPYLDGTLSVRSADGLQFAVEAGTNVVVFTPTVDGTYFVSAKLGYAFGASGSIYYSLVGRQITDDFVDNATTTGMLTLGSTKYGKWEAATDEDWFGVSLVAGKTYKFDLLPSASTPGLDGTLSVISADGTEAAVEAGSNIVVFTPTVSGTYFVSAHGQALAGSYRVIGRQITDDFVDNAATKGALALGTAKTAKWEAATDEDWFGVTLTANTTYRFDLTAVTAGSDHQLGIFSAGGEQASFDVGEKVLVFTPTVSGRYFVSAQAGTVPGQYSLLGRAIADDFDDNTTTVGKLTLGVSKTGKWEAPTDDDWFAVNLVANRTYKFDMTPAVAGVDGTLSVRSASGEEFAIELGGNTVVFSPQETATYYVSAQAALKTGSYSIIGRAITDDHVDHPNATEWVF
jgi:hypothetical protein